jgi:uncharacterized protein
LNTNQRTRKKGREVSSAGARSLTKLEEFARPYYAEKDAMHDLSHIRRFLRVARTLSKRYHADDQVLTCAAYFHGIDQGKHRGDLCKFLESQGLRGRRAEKVLRVALESQKESRPKTIEGKVLHDAHLLEGGRTFMVAKSLVTGILRGSSLREIADYFEDNIDGKFECYLPEARKAYAEKERFAREFFHSLKRSL